MSVTTVRRRRAMRSRGRLALVGVAAITGAALAGAVQPAPASASVRTAAAPFCGITWGSLPRSVGANLNLPTAAVTGLRSGEHGCYDRVVWDLSGPAGVVRVEYVPAVSDQARVLPLRGGAFLQVVLQNVAQHAWSGTGVELVAPTPTIRQASWLDWFEAFDTYGVGVRARLPFRVFILPGPGTGSRVVLDVAHFW